MNMVYMKKSKISAAYDVIVIGGGAAGMISAATAASSSCHVLLIEKNTKCGRKLFITGKGRCNVTNNCSPEEVLQNVPVNPRFLYSSVTAFPPSAVMALFDGLGVPLKTERGKRVFPVSDRAGDIVDALERYLTKKRVDILTGTVSELVIRDGKIRGVIVDGEMIPAGRVILATGGMSYPATGSTGDGYRMAEAAGHKIMPISGSLVPLEIVGGECRKMAGLSLRNVAIRLYGNKKKPVYEDFGEALFMNYGLSGPIILSCSAHMDEKKGPYRLVLDLKPALDVQKLDARILRDFQERKNDTVYEGIRGLLPAQMVPVILDRCGIPTSTPVNCVTREQRRKLLETIKGLTFEVAGKRPVEEAIITHGGVKVGEVNPGTMESKLVEGLYFAGEILDCDAYTGGFNLQIAWATGVAAGTSCGNFKNPVL